MKNRQAGFTLLEILMATAIFAFGVLVLIQSRTSSLRNTIDSEAMFAATQLAQSKMVEMEMKFQTRVNAEGVKDDLLVEEKGVFEAPFDQYRWEAKLTESSFKLKSSDLESLLSGALPEKEDVDAMLEQMKLLIVNVNKVVKENYAELAVTIYWDKYGRTYNLPLVTHIIPVQPKVQLTTNTDEGTEEE